MIKTKHSYWSLWTLLTFPKRHCSLRLIWLIVYYGLVPADSTKALAYIGLVVMCGVLATGVSWSHIRRRITGQVDTDELDGT